MFDNTSICRWSFFICVGVPLTSVPSVSHELFGIRLLHLAAPLHEVYCEMPSKCKCNELVSALLRLLPFCLENLIVAQLVHDLVVSIFTTGAHLHDHTARWREVVSHSGRNASLF